MNFVSTNNKGFRMKFDNGFAISVQWGTENYCEKRSFASDDNPREERFWASKTAEVAVFEDMSDEKNVGEKMIPIGEDDDVLGWLTANEVAKIIEIVSGYQGQTMTGMSGEDYIKKTIKSYNYFKQFTK